MAAISENIQQWPCLNDGLHYNWLVDYAAFSAFGTFELSPEEWEKRDLIVNFKGNSELTTEIDHQQALKKAIDMVVSYLKDVLGDEGSSITLVCIPASLKSTQSAASAVSANRYVHRPDFRMLTVPLAIRQRRMMMAMKQIHFILMSLSSRGRRYCCLTT